MKGLFIPEITAEMFRNGCLESIEALMAEGEIYDIDYEPERKKGRWIKHEVKLFDGCHTGRYFEECSECGKLTPEWRIVTEYHYWNFCPECGACNARDQDEQLEL